jgi:archaellum component FlaC
MSEKPNYVKEAFKEPLNIWAIIACMAASVYAATAGSSWLPLAWVPLAVGAAGEVFYLATVPATGAYRRLVDIRVRRRELAERKRRREEMIKRFDPREREAVEYLRWLKNEIYKNYKNFTRVETLPETIQSLETIWESFVDLLDIYRRRKQHLRSINRQMIQNQIKQTEQAIANAPDDDTRRLYEKNLEILNKRLQTYNDIERSVKRVEAQLQSIESFFGLVNDQVITMPTPESISSLDFESLLSSIELTKEILEETAPVLNNLDAAERASAQAVRPPLAQKQ